MTIDKYGKTANRVKKLNTNMITGIDCSKDFLDIAVLKDGKATLTGKYSNERKGFAKLVNAIKGSKLVVMEATGPYYLPVAIFLKEAGFAVAVVNPLVIRRFCQMRLSRAKTDKKDAVMIAKYGESEKPGEWEVPSDLILKTQQLETYLEGLKKRRMLVDNQLHSFKHTGKLSRELQKELEEEVKEYDRKIAQKEKEINGLLEKEFEKELKNLKSIPGIGDRSATLLMITTNGFKDFEYYKQLIAYFGLAPRLYESGTTVRGKVRICKMGMSSVRKTLYMAAKSAARFNKTCRELYLRLRAKGKPYKVAIIAVANKLIKQAFAVVKNDTVYNADFA